MSHVLREIFPRVLALFTHISNSWRVFLALCCSLAVLYFRSEGRNKKQNHFKLVREGKINFISLFAWACYLKNFSVSFWASLYNYHCEQLSGGNTWARGKIDHFVATSIDFDFFFAFMSVWWFISFHSRTHATSASDAPILVSPRLFFSFFFSPPSGWEWSDSWLPSSMRHELKIKTERSKKIFPIVRRPNETLGNLFSCLHMQTVLFRQMWFANAEVSARQRAHINRHMEITFRHRTAAHVCAHQSSRSAVHLEVY